MRTSWVLEFVRHSELIGQLGSCTLLAPAEAIRARHASRLRFLRTRIEAYSRNTARVVRSIDRGPFLGIRGAEERVVETHWEPRKIKGDALAGEVRGGALPALFAREDDSKTTRTRDSRDRLFCVYSQASEEEEEELEHLIRFEHDVPEALTCLSVRSLERNAMML